MSCFRLLGNNFMKPCIGLSWLRWRVFKRVYIFDTAALESQFDDFPPQRTTNSLWSDSRSCSRTLTLSTPPSRASQITSTRYIQLSAFSTVLSTSAFLPSTTASAPDVWLTSLAVDAKGGEKLLKIMEEWFRESSWCSFALCWICVHVAWTWFELELRFVCVMNYVGLLKFFWFVAILVLVVVLRLC